MPELLIPQNSFQSCSLSLQDNFVDLRGNGSRVDVDEILFIIFRTSEIGVLLDFNKIRCDDTWQTFSFPKTLVRPALCAY